MVSTVLSVPSPSVTPAAPLPLFQNPCPLLSITLLPSYCSPSLPPSSRSRPSFPSSFPLACRPRRTLPTLPGVPASLDSLPAPAPFDPTSRRSSPRPQPLHGNLKVALPQAQEDSVDSARKLLGAVAALLQLRWRRAQPANGCTSCWPGSTAPPPRASSPAFSSSPPGRWMWPSSRPSAPTRSCAESADPLLRGIGADRGKGGRVGGVAAGNDELGWGKGGWV